MAFTDLVNAFVKSFITPLIAAIFKGTHFTVRHLCPAPGKAAVPAHSPFARRCTAAAHRPFPLAILPRAADTAPRPAQAHGRLPPPPPTLPLPAAQDLYFTINESQFMYGAAINALIVFLLVLGKRAPRVARLMPVAAAPAGAPAARQPAQAAHARATDRS